MVKSRHQALDFGRPWRQQIKVVVDLTLEKVLNGVVKLHLLRQRFF